MFREFTNLLNLLMSFAHFFKRSEDVTVVVSLFSDCDFLLFALKVSFIIFKNINLFDMRDFILGNRDFHVVNVVDLDCDCVILVIIDKDSSSIWPVFV
jgi:hypothetical protein